MSAPKKRKEKRKKESIQVMIREKTWKRRKNYMNTNKETKTIDNEEAKMQNRRDSFHDNFHPIRIH